MSEEQPILVGAGRDWFLDVYEAVCETGEQGFHLNFRRRHQGFVMFLGRVEVGELIVRLERLLGREQQP